MSKFRKTALEFTRRETLGGSYQDSYSHGQMFKKYGPHNFGVRGAQLFSSELGSHLLNKKFVYMTKGSGRVFTLPDGVDDYKWALLSETDVEFMITDIFVPLDSKPGRGGFTFEIGLNTNDVHEPTVLKTENPNLPMMKIIGHGKRIDDNNYRYTVKLQDGDPASWIPVKYLMPGRRVIDATTSVTDELNNKQSSVSFNQMFELQSVVGNFARKVEMTDKFVRLEMGCRKSGNYAPLQYGVKGGAMHKGEGLGVGYMYYNKMSHVGDSGKAEVVMAGTYITKMEAILEERIYRDMEMNFEFGRLEFTEDMDSGRGIKVPPGWRQLVRDGHFLSHNGSLTLSDMSEYLMEIFITRRDFADRLIILATGEPGADFFSRLVANEASEFNLVTIDDKFIRTVDSRFHANALEYGSQFTSIKLHNGLVIQVQYDPIKDDRKIFPELAPGTNRTIEGYAYDIYDFGATDQKAAGASSDNITCVEQGGVEAYWTVSNVFDFNTGVIKDGSNAYSNNKELGIYREMSGGLGIWDTDRIGRIEFDPTLEY
jgi:hypothetical protein